MRWALTSRSNHQHSDYDVRFVYVRALESYFSIADGHVFPEAVKLSLWSVVVEAHTPQINEINEAVDVEGWELRKFLSMMHQRFACACACERVDALTIDAAMCVHLRC